LNESAWLLLTRALSEPKSVAALTNDLARLQGLASSPDQGSYVEDLLLRLEELGLVNRI
jgi:hypothetical protein